jgi:hypothetical protein
MPQARLIDQDEMMQWSCGSTIRLEEFSRREEQMSLWFIASVRIYKYTDSALSAGDHVQNPFGNTTDGFGYSLAVFLRRPFAHGYRRRTDKPCSRL